MYGETLGRQQTNTLPQECIYVHVSKDYSWRLKPMDVFLLTHVQPTLGSFLDAPHVRYLPISSAEISEKHRSNITDEMIPRQLVKFPPSLSHDVYLIIPIFSGKYDNLNLSEGCNTGLDESVSVYDNQFT